MRSFRLLFSALLFLLGAALHGQQSGLSEEEKKRQFLRAREEMRTLPMTPSPRGTPAPKPRPKPRVTRPMTTPVAPKPPAATPVPATPKPQLKPAATAPPQTRPQPTQRPRVTPRPVTPSPRRKLPPAPEAPVTIKKSGVEAEAGLQSAPSAGWFTRWKYLSKSLRAEIDKAPVKKRRWRYIVVHNSGTRQGSAKAFEYYHRRVRKMPNGLAYHFVIGNGTSTGDGHIEVGNRWRRQINGGHVHSDYLNNIALGICFVGDFNRDQPTKRQLEALDELIRYLRRRVGPIDRKPAIVKAHREINPPRWPTDCPGNKFPYRWLHSRFN